ncbi:Formamidase [Pseudoclavibacter triregionum]|nr:Formamidase [Pseudoclavibacter triregionum]
MDDERLLPSDSHVHAFGATFEPVASFGPGERVRIATRDCYSGQIADSAALRPGIDAARLNPATGPFAVRGVRAGDRVAIRIHAVHVSERGVMPLAPGLGLLGDRVVEPSTAMVEVRDGMAMLPGGIGVQVRPMIGVLGVATGGPTVPTSTPGPHGGNLDTRLLGAGATLCVTARADGLGLALGDLHAVQGDGELGGTGVEIAGEVVLSVQTLAGAAGDAELPAAATDTHLPVVVDEDGIRVLASAETLEEALRLAFLETVELMSAWNGLEWPDAYRLASVTCHAEVSQVVNPLRTARIFVPRDWVGAPYDELMGGA